VETFADTMQKHSSHHSMRSATHRFQRAPSHSADGEARSDAAAGRS